jgi:hypothetical protein
MSAHPARGTSNGRARPLGTSAPPARCLAGRRPVTPVRRRIPQTYVTGDNRRCPRSGWTLSVSVGSRRTLEPPTGGGCDPSRRAARHRGGEHQRGLNGSSHSVQAGGAAYGIRTRDLRITRAPRKHSPRSTSTDSTPHGSQSTQRPGGTHDPVRGAGVRTSRTGSSRFPCARAATGRRSTRTTG